MNGLWVATFIQEGGRVLSELLKMRSSGKAKAQYEAEVEKLSLQITPPEPLSVPIAPAPRYVPVAAPVQIKTPETPETPALGSEDMAEKATAVKTGCIPCALGHVGTCTGLLNEAVRFARAEGVASAEVIQRTNMCLDELNAMERVDMRPEMLVALPEWERQLAEQTLDVSRQIRHGIEGMQDAEGLVQTAAKTQTLRQEIGTKFFKEKLKRFSPEDKAEIARRVIAKLEDAQNEEEDPEIHLSEG